VGNRWIIQNGYGRVRLSIRRKNKNRRMQGRMLKNMPYGIYNNKKM